MQIFKVQHLMRKIDGSIWTAISDLIYLDGKPVIVYEWVDDLPGTVLPLEAEKLTLMTGQIDFLYDGVLQEPPAPTGHH
ncbi:hypothetical protein [Labrys neptuniae]